jgi:hypothetical protein
MSIKHYLYCPQCRIGRDHPYGVTVNDITTLEDKELGLERYAIRCEGCGYATSFIGKPTLEGREEENAS